MSSIASRGPRDFVAIATSNRAISAGSIYLD